MITAIYYISMVILGYFAILWIGYLAFLLATFVTVIRKFKEIGSNEIITTLNTNPVLPITIIIPAYNESYRIMNTNHSPAQFRL